MNPLVRFDAKFRISGNELVLTYEVENRSTRDLYMLDRIERGRPYPYRADPNVIYVHLDSDTKTVWLNKRIPAWPKGQSPSAPKYPAYTPLRAGATAREEVRVPLPIREFGAYSASPPESELSLTHYRKVYFTLQYCWRTDGMTEGSYDLDGQKVLTTQGNVTEADFGLLETPRVELDLPVLEPRR